MVTIRFARVDQIRVRVTHIAPSGIIFTSLIGLDPIDTKQPTANNSTGCKAFATPSNAHVSDNIYAVAQSSLFFDRFETMYSGFGFTIPTDNTITKVELLCEWIATMTEDGIPTPPDGITIICEIGKPGSPDTCVNFTSYPEGSAMGSESDRTAEGVAVFDVTNTGHSFIPSDFDNANLRFSLSALLGPV